MSESNPPQLFQPVAQLRGVGPRAPLFAKLGLRTLADLLFYFPRDYEDLSDLRGIDHLEDDKLQTVRGRVVEVDVASSGFGKSRVGVLIENGGHHLRAMWFNQPFMRDRFQVGQQVQFSGKPRLRGNRWELAHPRITWLDDAETDPTEPLLALYSLTEGLSQFHVRRAVRLAVEQCADLVEEVLPEPFRQVRQLASVGEALRWIHLPPSAEALESARRRLVFQELLVMQLALAARRWQQRVAFKAPELAATAQIAARIERLLPFELTPGQHEAIAQITADMALDTPMNRLLQGDVGSGKTVVALYALLVAVAHRYQAALMAPTEILARQHAHTLDRMLQASRVRWELLVGGQSAVQRAAVLDGLVSGEVDLVIGTHAILQESVQFARLGLVVIDEQHKFGVKQRAALRRGDVTPHYLVMTATPIPRTVSMTQFGDLDVSVVRDMPPGRQPVSTFLVEHDQTDRWWHFVRNKLSEGRQAYVVVPLVEESETIAAVSVDQAFEALTNGQLADYRVGMLHGRMTPADKDEAMEEFRRGRLQVLVSTTVIEVGVDVPNASVMVVASPERFGLAQLHQLRGRVGRGSWPGYCGLLLPTELVEAARERLTQFTATTSGFDLAEIDFRMRGPGDLFGTQQHGLPPLRIADLVRDAAMVGEARQAASELFAADPGLKAPEHTRLRRQMLARYGTALDLGDVG